MSDRYLFARAAYALSMLRSKRSYIVATGIYLCERVAFIGLNFLVFVLMARAYGATQMGIYSYAQSWMNLAMPFLASSAEPVVIRELVRSQDRRGEVLGSSALIVGCTTLLSTAIPLSFLLTSQKMEVSTIAALIAVGLLPTIFLLLEHCLKADMCVRTTASVRFFTSCFFAAGKIVLIKNGYPLTWIVALTTLEAFTLGVVFVLAYRAFGNRFARWKLDIDTIRFIAAQAFPTMFSALFVFLLFRINHVLLGYFGNFSDLGRYAVGFQVSQMFGIVPTVILSAIMPRLVAIHRDNRSRFEDFINWAFFGLTVIGYLLLFVTYMTSNVLMILLGKVEYSGAQWILLILTASMVFNFSGVVRSQVINLENAPKLHFFNAVLGLGCMLPLSVLLIPAYGALGAAWSTAFGAFVSGILTSCISSKTRVWLPRQIKSLCLIPPRSL